MLKRSIYLRIVGIFISIVLISLFVSFVITSLFFPEDTGFEEEIIDITTGVAGLIESAEADQIPGLIERLQEFHFNVFIEGEDGLVYATDNPGVINEGAAAGIHRSGPGTPFVYQDAYTRVGGMPIEINGENYTLYVHVDYEEEEQAVRKVILIALLLVLITGSLLIVLASRYIVDPIRKLTGAAKEIAKGNFSTRIKSKNDKSEVGELIRSFNHMASEVEKTDQMREDFVSSVSHEIQSPLTSIRGFTKAIRDEVVPLESQKEYLDIIYQETERLSRVSESLLQLASLESEHYPFNLVSFRLDEQIRRVVLATEPQWKDKSLRIHLELEPILASGDEDLLKQVWLNLISNAVKYSEDGGEIRVVMQKEGEMVKVSVSDTGKGIPEKAIPYLFERFYKVDKARSSSTEGTGLGLSIVKKILELHNAFIDVDSKEGEGSVFTVTLYRSFNTTGEK
ncbi:sensor histidine kinase [Evansella clarkii]|uniref:sensor histidine kinase n=1 Tax=Evansella clarkii TaxID=79879 RepID=UPI0009987FEF|nr:HAMP domain-containing sensor histidine kinase [Evansella clarkii]